MYHSINVLHVMLALSIASRRFPVAARPWTWHSDGRMCYILNPKCRAYAVYVRLGEPLQRHHGHAPPTCTLRQTTGIGLWAVAARQDLCTLVALLARSVRRVCVAHTADREWQWNHVGGCVCVCVGVYIDWRRKACWRPCRGVLAVCQVSRRDDGGGDCGSPPRAMRTLARRYVHRHASEHAVIYYALIPG